MVKTFTAVLFAAAALLPVQAFAQKYTVVAVCHTENKVAEVDPATGTTLRTFVVPGEWVGETHEGAITADGRTLYVSTPYQKKVLIVDLATFTQKGVIESPYFSRPAEVRSFVRIGKRETTSSDPHGVALNDDETKLYSFSGVRRSGRRGRGGPEERQDDEDRHGERRELPVGPAENEQAVLPDPRQQGDRHRHQDGPGVANDRGPGPAERRRLLSERRRVGQRRSRWFDHHHRFEDRHRGEGAAAAAAGRDASPRRPTAASWRRRTAPTCRSSTSPRGRSSPN